MQFDQDRATAIPSQSISPLDGMFHGNLEHYLACGESALRVLLSAISLGQSAPPKCILDFGAGAGRVTRWLKAHFPEANIHACDIRDQDMTFLRSTFGIEAWTVGVDVDALEFPSRYDLVWVGSVITHLSEHDTRTLISKLFSSCKPGGLLALSFHGQHAFERHERANIQYIHKYGWKRIKSAYLASGYGYADYVNQKDYGISIISTEWMIKFTSKIINSRLVLLSEQAWDNHHDVIVLQKTI